MASENVRKKLKQLLERGSNKDTFKEDIKWFITISSFLWGFNVFLLTEVVDLVSFVFLKEDGCSSELDEDNESDDWEESVLSSMVKINSLVWNNETLCQTNLFLSIPFPFPPWLHPPNMSKKEIYVQ